MPAPAEPPVDFHDVLRKVWWRLDRALNPWDMELCSWMGLLDAVACDSWKKEHYFEYHQGHNCGICAAVCPHGRKLLQQPVCSASP